jgi:type IV secretion system protein VirB10
MTDETHAEKLTARMERMRPSETPKRRRGINPYALSAVTAVAGVGVGAWLVLAAPDAPAPAPAIETASVSDFQGDGTGTDGFSVSRPKPQIVPAAPDTSEAERLQAEIEALNAQIADLKANPVTVTDEAALADLKAQVAALDADAKARAAALSDLERENIRLQTELETKLLIDGDSEAEAARAREEELARRRQEAEMLNQAQIYSDMVALRSSMEMGGETGAAAAPAPGAPGQAATGDDAFRRAGAKAAEVRQAEVIADPAHTVMQGTLIEAALETAISTDLAGNVSAIVSHDVWSFDMSRVLIPRGSRLFGRYDSEVDAGQRRVLIAWDRLVTTDGQSVSLAAYGTDRIGRSGLPGTVRNHFLQRFGTAALISVIGAVPAIASARYADDEVASDTAENVGTDLGEAVNTVIADYLSIPPTISVNQGAVVMIRVDADLAFY